MEAFLSTQKSFLVSHRGALGDFALTFPTLSLLRWKFKEYRFVGLGKPSHMELAASLGFIDSYYDSESASFLPFYSGSAIPPELEGVESALLWMNTDPAMESLVKESWTGTVHFHPPFPDGQGHVLEHHLEALVRFTLPGEMWDEPYFPMSPKRQDFALIHPGSGSASKNYDPEFYAFIAQELKSTRFPDTRILLGPCEEGLRHVFEKRFPLVETHSCTELARILSQSSLFIGNDSGVSHLSGLLGSRTLAMYKNSNHGQWGVRGRHVQILEAANEAQAMTRIQRAIQEMV